MKHEFKLDRHLKYLVGASGGSDSMALLSLCLKAKIKLVVCHINYKLRDNADKEEALLKRYCDDNKIKVYTLYPKQNKHENFQNWAREVRYEFYKEVYDKENCDCLLLGHQMDDHIENYLIAKERGSHGWYYGISDNTEVYGMKIKRPLLSWRKSETRKYCLKNNVPFGDDESNFSDKYTRNKIRHQLVEPADRKQIKTWLKEIDELNNEIDKRMSYVLCNYDMHKDISIEKFNKEAMETKKMIIRKYLWDNNQRQMVSNDYVKEIIRRLNMQPDGHGVIDINNDYVFVYEYGVFYISKKENDFTYTLNHIEYFENDCFALKEEGRTIEGVTLTEADFPITIRSHKDSDAIELRFGHKRVNRFLIDRKIFYRDRICWPVIENKDGIVIFVYNIGCDIHHFSIKPNLFMIK